MAMGELEPEKIAEAIEGRKPKKAPPSELELQKEARLAAKEKRLDSGSAAGKAAPDRDSRPPPAVVEVDKSLLLDKLMAYKERFPHLKKRNNVSVKSSTEDILDELHYCEMQLGSKQDSNMGAMLLHGSMVAAEAIARDVWNPLGLNLNGLAKVTKDNMSEFQPIVDELMIKYGAGMYMSVEMRLVLSVGALMMTVHGANSGNPAIAAALEKVNVGVAPPKGSEDL